MAEDTETKPEQTEEKPAEEKAPEQKPADEKPVEEKPVEESNGKSDDKPSDDKPAEEEKPPEASGEPAAEGKPRITAYKLKPVSKLLDDALAEAPPANETEDIVETASKRRRYPLVFDIVLGAGLLVAVGGFTIGLFKMYVTYSAKQSIADNNYAAAIKILQKNPMPPGFSVAGNDPQDLLDQALYADGMKKISEDNDVRGGIAELEQIRPGSQYFDNAQTILSENFEPSSTQLTGGVSTEGKDK